MDCQMRAARRNIERKIAYQLMKSQVDIYHHQYHKRFPVTKREYTDMGQGHK